MSALLSNGSFSASRQRLAWKSGPKEHAWVNESWKGHADHDSKAIRHHNIPTLRNYLVVCKSLPIRGNYFPLSLRRVAYLSTGNGRGASVIHKALLKRK